MKSLCFILLAVVLMSSCKIIKTDDKTTDIVKPSQPGLTLKGDAIISTGIGTGNFTDPGAVGYDSVRKVSTELQPLVNAVDLTKPGFYAVQYEAKDVYGYRNNKNRLVLVTSTPASDDISGEYRRTNGQVVTLTKKGTGLYVIDNIGGVASNPDYLFDVYIGVPTLTSLAVPEQENPFGGNVFVSDATITRSGSSISFSYIVRGAGFGTAKRTFNKI
jgi:hypothetical protein